MGSDVFYAVHAEMLKARQLKYLVVSLKGLGAKTNRLAVNRQ
jgi:hypothetical protein